MLISALFVPVDVEDLRCTHDAGPVTTVTDADADDSTATTTLLEDDEEADDNHNTTPPLKAACNGVGLLRMRALAGAAGAAREEERDKIAEYLQRSDTAVIFPEAPTDGEWRPTASAVVTCFMVPFSRNDTMKEKRFRENFLLIKSN